MFSYSKATIQPSKGLIGWSFAKVEIVIRHAGEISLNIPKTGARLLTAAQNSATGSDSPEEVRNRYQMYSWAS